MGSMITANYDSETDQIIDASPRLNNGVANSSVPVMATTSDQGIEFDAPTTAAIANVGITQSFPGSVVRKLAEKFGELVSIKDFGAVGDNVVDDTAAIQAAIDSGVRLFAPEGNYRVTGLVANSGLSLHGEGSEKTQFSCTTPGIPCFNFAPSASGKAYKLSDLYIKNGSYGVRFSAENGAGYISRESKLSGVSFGSQSVCGLKIEIGMIGCAHEKINFEQPGQYGIWSEGSDILGSTVWTAVRVSSATEAGVFLKETGTQGHPNITFVDLIVEGGQKHGIRTYSTLCTLINPHFENNGKAGDGTSVLYADIFLDGDGLLRNSVHLVGGYFSTANAKQSNLRIFANANGQYFRCDNTYFRSSDVFDVNRKSSSCRYNFLGTVPVIKNGVLGIVTVTPGVIGSTTIGAEALNNTAQVVEFSGRMTRSVSSITFPFSSFVSASSTADVAAFVVPAKTRIVGIYADVTTAFSGAGWTAATIALGKTVGGAQYLLEFDCMTAPVTKGLSDADLGASLARASAVQGADVPSWTASTTVNLRIAVTGGTVNGITSGSVTLYIITEKMT